MAAALFGYEIESPFPIRSARPGPCSRGRLRIEPSTTDLRDRTGELIAWDDAGDGEFAMARVQDGILVWCSLTGAYLLDPQAGSLRINRRGPPEPWEHRIVSTIIPLLLAERGDLALHGATVLAGDRAVVFCGPRGRGKSTLSAALALRGHMIASEDGTVISDLNTVPLAWAGTAGVRVTADTLTALGGTPASQDPRGKALRFPATGQTGALPASELAAVVVLRERAESALRLSRLDPPAAIPALMPNLHYGGPARLPRTLGLAGALAERVPVFEAQLADDLSSVGEAARTILELVTRGP